VPVKLKQSNATSRHTTMVGRTDPGYSWGLMILVIMLIIVVGYLVVRNGHADNGCDTHGASIAATCTGSSSAPEVKK
jgi:hypothetical protein